MSNKTADANIPVRPSGFGTRVIVCLMLFTGQILALFVRVSLPVTIIAMVNSTASENSTSLSEECKTAPLQDEEEGGDIDWDAKEQGLALGVFTMGYVMTQLAGGILAERFGGKWVYGLAVLLSTTLGALSPVTARYNATLFMVLRAIQGASQGPAWPALYTISTKWFPHQERVRLFTFVGTGTPIGLIIGMQLSGLITDAVGWEAVFYTIAAGGAAWFIVYFFLLYSTPADHPRISKEERAYIEASIPAVPAADKKLFPDLRKLATSPPFLALLVYHMCHNYGFYALMNAVPTYLNNIHHFSIKQNGLTSSLPYLTLFVLSFPVSISSDVLVNSKVVSKTIARKFFNTLGSSGAAIGLFWLAWGVECDSTMAVVALCMAVGISAGVYGGFILNHADLSPNYSGILMGITETCANCGGFIAPIVMGSITNNNQTMKAWGTVFSISASLYVFGNLIFLIFGRTNVQSFDDIETKGLPKSDFESNKAETTM